jgi:hypothetical protein
MTDTPETPTIDSALDIRARALKERIYATFTGLAVLAAIFATGHGDAWEAFRTVAVSIVGISAAGFLAEFVSYQVVHQRFPDRSEIALMVRIALSALGTASIPLLLLAAAGFGLVGFSLALTLGMVIYALTLVPIFLIASRHSGLHPLQRIISSALFVTLALVVIGVLLLAHVH